MARLLIGLIVWTVATAGCTSEKGETSSPAITVIAKWGEDSEEGHRFGLVLNAFEDRTGISVNYIGAGNELPLVLSTRVASGNPPDIAVLPQPGLLKDLAMQEILSPLTDTILTRLERSFARVWIDLASYENVPYGVFFKASNKSTVWYDPEFFSKNGLNPPSTWDEWIALSTELSDEGIVPLAVGAADGWVLSDWFENVYVRTAGPTMYDQLTLHEIPWTHSSVKKALRTLGKLLTGEGHLLEGPDGALRTTFVESVQQVFSEEASATMIYEGDFVPGIVAKETTSSISPEFFEFPSIDGSAPVVVGGGDVAVAFNELAETMAFLEFLAEPTSAEIWAAFGGFTSPNRDVDPSVYPNEASRKSAASLAKAEIFRFDLSDLVSSCFGATAGVGIWGGLQEWLSHPEDIDRITNRLEQDASC